MAISERILLLATTSPTYRENLKLALEYHRTGEHKSNDNLKCK